MSYAEHRALVVGATGLDLKVRPQTVVIEPARSNPGLIRWGRGGVARNIAENLARLSVEVQLITAVGDDWWGQMLLHQLRDLGINTDACIISDEHPTGSYVRGLVRDADIVCIDANLSTRSLQTLFRLTSEYDVPVCADPTAALLAHRLCPYLPQIMAITPDLDEAEALVGQKLQEDRDIGAAARRLVQSGVDLAIITLGASGLYYATSAESGRIPPFPVEVVDVTGAGDALTAAVAYGLLEGMSPEETVRLGTAAAAQTIACHETVCPDLSLELLYERLVM